MNLINLLDYGNSVYDLNKKINGLSRQNDEFPTKPSTVLKMAIAMILTRMPSIHYLMNSIDSPSKPMRKLFCKGEFVPKTHALRDCITDTDYHQVSKILEDMVYQLKRNKFFENHTYRGKHIVIADGLEEFETKKNISGLHNRRHKNGEEGHYFKALGLMYMADDVDIMLDLYPFEKNDVKEDIEHNEKIKSEGEITVLKKLIPRFKEYYTDICVLDAMFLNAPCLNLIKEEGMEAVVRLKDKKRLIYQDAEKLFQSREEDESYEIVKRIELKKKKYSKASKKKTTSDSQEYYFTRPISGENLKEKIVVEEKTVSHPKYESYIKVTEEVIKKVQVWEDEFELTNYQHGNVLVIRTIETTKKDGKEQKDEMYLVTTLLEEPSEFIVDLMHRRWDIELRGFRKLKTTYHLNHLYIGNDNAIRLLSYLTLIIFNLVELYFNVHTKKQKRKFSLTFILEGYRSEISSKPIYKYFLVT